MPYQSAGCQTCKTRRIKCDEAKPTCQRCAKSRRVCLESSAVKEFLIHVENSYASGKTKRPRGPRSSLTLFRPNIDLVSRAVTYYLNYYLDALKDLPTVSACMSECLTAWKSSRRQCNMIDLAISSVALAIFSRTQHCSPAAREASLRYCYLLRVAREQITQTEILTCTENGIDECLLSVVLMSRYETTTCWPANSKPNNSFSSLHSWSHYDGAMAILKIWNDNLSYNTPSSIIKQARRGLIRVALLKDCPVPIWMRDGSRFGEYNLDLSFDSILVQIVNLRYAVKRLKQKKGLQTAEAEGLNNEAKNLGELCHNWTTQIPSTWSYQLHSIKEANFWPKRDFYSSTVYSYAQPAYAAVWLQYFAAQTLISSTRLTLLQLSCPLQSLDFTFQQQFRECNTQLKAMASSLASTIPFSLGRITVNNTEARDGEPKFILNTDEEIRPAFALPTVWPLSMVSSIDGIEPKQQLWFRAQIARLGCILGDGALQCAGTDSWIHDMVMAGQVNNNSAFPVLEISLPPPIT